MDAFFVEPVIQASTWIYDHFDIYVYPLISSVVAGIIFWLIFSVLPSRQRRKSFRLVIDKDFLDLHGKINTLYSTFLRPSAHWPSLHQRSTLNQTLGFEELRIALANKMFWPAENIRNSLASHFLLIGEEVKEHIEKTEKTIDRLYTFNYFLSAHDVDLLNKIHSKLLSIAQSAKPVQLPPGAILANPTCSNMVYSLIELQSLYRKLSECVFELKIDSEDFYKSKATRQYHQDSFKKCIKTCVTLKKEYPNNSKFADFLTAICTYKLGKKQKAYELFSKAISVEHSIFGWQEEVLPLAEHDLTLETILLKHLGDLELGKLKTDLKTMEARKENFRTRNQRLLEQFCL